MTQVHKPAAKVDRPEFPALVEDIGEDPARFLYDPDDQRVDLALARIRGIDYVQVLNAWLAVERRVNGGRPEVTSAIEARREILEEHGEREQLTPEELERRRTERMPDGVDDDATDDEPSWVHEKCGSTDVEQESSMAWFCHECQQRTNRVERVQPQTVAADGGDLC